MAAAAAWRTYVDFVPPHSLLQEPDKVVLRVDLSAEGFSKEQLRAQVDNLGRLRISGERPLRADSKLWRRFSEDFQVPEGCDAGAIRARLEKEGGALLVTMPRLLSPAAAVVAGASAGSVDAAGKDQRRDDNGTSWARQEAAAPAAAAAEAVDEENKEEVDDAGDNDAPMEQRRGRDEQHVTSNKAGGAAAYGFAKSRRTRMVWAIAALVLALVGAGLYARYNRLMDPSAETVPAGNHIVALSDN